MTAFREDLPRAAHLPGVGWLAAVLAGQVVPAPPAPHMLLLEAGFDGLDSFLSGHLPGARYFDTRQIEQLPFWNLVPPAELREVLRHAGIRADSTVLLYGRNTLAAARVAHALLVTGVRDVRLLDGGLDAWCDAGHALERGPLPAPEPAPPDAMDALVARPDYLLDTAQARALLGELGAALVSIRTHVEFMGETSGYSYIAARGEIAGALWGHAGADGDVNSMANFQDAEGCMKPAAEIAAIWAAAGILPGMRIGFYCGTGWRASLAFFHAWLMGWERIAVYDGGWFEWSSDPANPVICRSAQPPTPARPQSGPVPQSQPT